MPLPQVRNSLWTTEGEHALEKDVVPINRMELSILARLHEFAQKHGVSLVCKRCDRAITGRNSGQEDTPAVSCLCREFRYTGA